VVTGARGPTAGKAGKRRVNRLSHDASTYIRKYRDQRLLEMLAPGMSEVLESLSREDRVRLIALIGEAAGKTEYTMVGSLECGVEDGQVVLACSVKPVSWKVEEHAR